MRRCITRAPKDRRAICDDLNEYPSTPFRCGEGLECVGATATEFGTCQPVQASVDAGPSPDGGEPDAGPGPGEDDAGPGSADDEPEPKPDDHLEGDCGCTDMTAPEGVGFGLFALALLAIRRRRR